MSATLKRRLKKVFDVRSHLHRARVQVSKRTGPLEEQPVPEELQALINSYKQTRAACHAILRRVHEGKEREAALSLPMVWISFAASTGLQEYYELLLAPVEAALCHGIEELTAEHLGLADELVSSYNKASVDQRYYRLALASIERRGVSEGTEKHETVQQKHDRAQSRMHELEARLVEVLTRVEVTWDRVFEAHLRRFISMQYEFYSRILHEQRLRIHAAVLPGAGMGVNVDTLHRGRSGSQTQLRPTTPKSRSRSSSPSSAALVCRKGFPMSPMGAYLASESPAPPSVPASPVSPRRSMHMPTSPRQTSTPLRRRAASVGVSKSAVIRPGLDPGAPRVFVGTWNVGNAEPPRRLDTWLKASNEQLDVIAIGVQECEYKLAGESSQSVQEHFLEILQRTLGDEYLLVVSTNIMEIGPSRMRTTAAGNVIDGLKYPNVGGIGGLRLYIFVERQHRDHIADVHISKEATGVAGVTFNKGGVAASFSFYGVHLAFVNCHLAAHQDHVAERNSDVAEIIDGLNLGNPWLDVTNQFDIVFWLGDLNYRLNLDRERVLAHIEREKFGALIQYDQLVEQQEQNAALIGFSEAEIRFPPTYRFDRGSSVYDTSAKQRIPAYCDRVLWRAFEEREPDVLAYQHDPSIATSDHRPVLAVFALPISLAPINDFGDTRITIIDISEIDIDLTLLRERMRSQSSEGGARASPAPAPAHPPEILVEGQGCDAQGCDAMDDMSDDGGDDMSDDDDDGDTKRKRTWIRETAPVYLTFHTPLFNSLSYKQGQRKNRRYASSIRLFVRTAQFERSPHLFVALHTRRPEKIFRQSRVARARLGEAVFSFCDVVAPAERSPHPRDQSIDELFQQVEQIGVQRKVDILHDGLPSGQLDCKVSLKTLGAAFPTSSLRRRGEGE